MIIFGGVISQTMGPGGPGFPLMMIVVIAVFSGFAENIMRAMGQGQTASMAKTVSTFICIGLVITTVLGTLYALAKAFHVTL